MSRTLACIEPAGTTPLSPWSLPLMCPTARDVSPRMTSRSKVASSMPSGANTRDGDKLRERRAAHHLEHAADEIDADVGVPRNAVRRGSEATCR